jgi:hypothetical protein
MIMKRWWYLTHRWVGIGVCLLMVMWFVSGVVMMYVGYPKLSTSERLAALPSLSVQPECCAVPQALREPQASFKSIRLTTIATEPTWIAEPLKGPPQAWRAMDGVVAGFIDRKAAERSASAFASAKVQVGEPVQEDAFSHSRALDPHRPLWPAKVLDGSGVQLYVSSRTGEVVRDVSATEARWNWAGAWIHWLYPFRGNFLDRWWHDIVVWLSVIGSVLALTGMVVGVWRWRFSGRYKNGSHSPYRSTMLRWHHITGLIGGTLALTWIFSGLMSMNPWKVFESSADKPDLVAYGGGPLRLDQARIDLGSLIASFSAQGPAPRELSFQRTAGELQVVSHSAGEPARRLDGAFDIDMLTAKAGKLLPKHKVIESRLQTDYDLWYYARASHTMLGHIDKPLPVLRVDFSDPHATTIYLDPATGAIVGRLDTAGRWKRWLFAFLHSFDAWPLLAARPLWDGLLIVASIAGLIISATGVVLGWRRLQR